MNVKLDRTGNRAVTRFIRLLEHLVDEKWSAWGVELTVLDVDDVQVGETCVCLTPEKLWPKLLDAHEGQDDPKALAVADMEKLSADIRGYSHDRTACARDTDEARAKRVASKDWRLAIASCVAQERI